MRMPVKLAAVISLALIGACMVSPEETTRRIAAPPAHERPDAPGERAAFDNARRLPAGVRAIDPAWYASAETRAQGMARFSTKAGRFVTGEKTAPRWEWLGPSNVGGRTVSEIADRFLEQSTLKGGALPHKLRPRRVGHGPVAAHSVAGME